MAREKALLNADDIRQTLERLAAEVVERHPACADLVVVGIQRRGADLARRLQTSFSSFCAMDVPLAELDINLYRDDWSNSSHMPIITPSRMPVDITNKAILLVDDVLYTGRTTRAALEALLDFGRPRCVELLTLVDRGHRELPIQADYIGYTIPTSRESHVDVHLVERDGDDGVYLTEP